MKEWMNRRSKKENYCRKVEWLKKEKEKLKIGEKCETEKAKYI